MAVDDKDSIAYYASLQQIFWLPTLERVSFASDFVFNSSVPANFSEHSNSKRRLSKYFFGFVLPVSFRYQVE
ncbi:hypothetical protein [Hymenobacter glacieicola]|uniref:hypothetical protein n=1 Tax=Hymenobacter glacieicola TaxID=1562124 RepID=UPI001E422745|nr:hypothetical protein [Hymenobacter glacieicola]